MGVVEWRAGPGSVDLPTARPSPASNRRPRLYPINKLGLTGTLNEKEERKKCIQQKEPLIVVDRISYITAWNFCHSFI